MNRENGSVSNKDNKAYFDQFDTTEINRQDKEHFLHPFHPSLSFLNSNPDPTHDLSACQTIQNQIYLSNGILAFL